LSCLEVNLEKPRAHASHLLLTARHFRQCRNRPGVSGASRESGSMAIQAAAHGEALFQRRAVAPGVIRMVQARKILRFAGSVVLVLVFEKNASLKE
jgi:hypothetical protein